MTTSEQGAAIHEAVAEVLAVTPRSPLSGHTVVDFVRIDDGGPEAECSWGGVWGDPAPIAARQAAAVLRWAAEYDLPPALRLRFNEGPSTWLTRLADDIDPQEDDDATR